MAGQFNIAIQVAAQAGCGEHKKGWQVCTAPAPCPSTTCLTPATTFDRHTIHWQAAERDYDLNRAAELKYGTLLELQKQLKEAEALLEQAEQVIIGMRA